MAPSVYKPIDCGFHDVLEATITRRTYTHLQYFTDLWEFTTVTGLLKNLVSERDAAGLAEYLVIDTGERIRLDRVVNVNGTFAPPFRHYHDFTCDC
jgi:Rho-binding antiterminator